MLGLETLALMQLTTATLNLQAFGMPWSQERAVLSTPADAPALPPLPSCSLSAEL